MPKGKKPPKGVWGTARYRQKMPIKKAVPKGKKPFNEKNKKEFLEEYRSLIDRITYLINKGKAEEFIWDKLERGLKLRGWHEDSTIRNWAILEIKKLITNAFD